MKKLLAVVLLMLTFPAFAAAEKIGWKDLIPEGFTPPPVKPQSYYDANPEEDRQTNLDAPVVESLNGKKVRIPGYVVQL